MDGQRPSGGAAGIAALVERGGNLVGMGQPQLQLQPMGKPAPARIKRQVSNEMKAAVRNLGYSAEDLEMLADDSRQFEMLKQSLRKKGAVTNEVLKQKLPLFLKYSRDRKGPVRRTQSANLQSIRDAQLTAERTRNLRVNQLYDSNGYVARQPSVSNTSSSSDDSNIAPGGQQQGVGGFLSNLLGPDEASDGEDGPPQAGVNGVLKRVQRRAKKSFPLRTKTM